MLYFVYLLTTFVISAALTLLVRSFMLRFNVVDRPRVGKIHKKSIPLGGGLAIYVCVAAFFLFAYWRGDLGSDVSYRYILAILFGGGLIIIGGVLDDILSLSVVTQLFFSVLAILPILVVGLVPTEVSHPFGGVFKLGIVAANALVFMWLMSVMFTTKLLDGLDGLVGGTVVIGALLLLVLVREPNFWRPEVALMTIIFVGAVLGFLLFNFNPAKIFLGQGGSILTGYMLGTLAILAGGKIATTVLVLAVPMLDIVRVIFRRWQKRKSIWVGDTEHLHFKLLDLGLNQRQVVLLYYLLSLLFGSTAFLYQRHYSLAALVTCVALAILIFFVYGQKDIQHKKTKHYGRKK